MQYPWVILDSFGQAADIKCLKFVTKNTRMFQKLNLLAVHLKQSLALTVLKRLKVKMKYQPVLLFIQVKTVSSLWQAAKSINYEISKKNF